MANTKHSAAREIIIDRLLRERRGYCVKEIWEKVNEGLMLQELAPVSINTIRNDIENIQSLYKKVLISERRGGGKEWYYQYKDPDCSLFTNVLTLGELQLIQSALNTIRYIDPMEGTMMYKELPERVASILGVETEENPVVIYESLPTLKDLKKFRALYEMILKHIPACISYKNKLNIVESDMIVHPYFLLNCADKWYLLCHNETTDIAAEISLSDINSIEVADGVKFIPNKDFPLKNFYKKLFSKK